MSVKSILRSEGWIFVGLILSGQGCVEPWAGKVQEGLPPESGLKVRLLGGSIGTEAAESGSVPLDYAEGAWRPQELYRFPESSEVFFSVEGELSGSGPVLDAHLSFQGNLIGSKSVHGIREMGVPTQNLIDAMNHGEVRGRLDILVGTDWKSYDVRLPVDVPLPAIPVLPQEKARGVSKGPLFGIDLLNGKVEAWDAQVRNTSRYPVQIFVRTYSPGTFKLTTRIDDVSGMGTQRTQAPLFGQVRAEVTGLRVYRSTQKKPEEYERLPPDWVGIPVNPGETVQLAYLVRALEAKAVLFDTRSRKRLYMGMRMKGEVPRDLVLSVPEVGPEEVSALLQTPDADPERIRFLTRASGHQNPILGFQSRYDFVTGGGISDLDWERASPRLREGHGRVFDIR